MLAVETRFAGTAYRSRTEAEWAAMLMAHGVRFDYEPINFRFSFVAPSDWGHSLHYIPDFWLRDLKLWLEVKPHRPNLIEYRKAALLAECSGSGVLVTTGGPGTDELVFVKSLHQVESVSTTGAAPLPQGPLKLDLATLTNSRFFGRPFQPFTAALGDCIDACNDAYREFFGMADAGANRKRVIFLPPDADPSAACFDDPTQQTYCRGCSGVRALLTDESFGRLQSLG